jgi:hypothetical protein
MHPMEWLEPAHPPEGTSGTGNADIPAQDMSSAEPVTLQWSKPNGNEQSGGVAPPNEWLPEKGRKPDVEQGMKLDRDGNEMPAPPVGDGLGLDDWQRWGEVPGVGGGSPFDDPANPYIPPGDGDRGPGGSADPEDRGPILGNMPNPSNIGIDWQEPGDDSRGGSKDPWGGPGRIHPGKGPPGSGHVGQDYHFDPVPVYMSPWGRRQKAKEESYKRAEDMARFCDANAQGPLRYEPNPKPTDCDDSSSASDYDQHNEEKERWKKAQAEFEREKARMEQLRKWRKKNGGCEGSLDTGGGFEPPTSTADVDQSKAGGTLVSDPPAIQWGRGVSGVDTSNHPNQVSNPGYEGGRGAIDGGVKHDPTLAGDPPQKSGN